MTVELAVVTPVVIVVALIVLNLMGFIEACAAFDQAALDCVVAHGVSPSGEQSEDSAVGEVSSALEAALSDYGSCEVSVRAERVGEGSEGSSFAVSALLTRYVCTLVYRPWPMVVRMPGFPMERPSRSRMSASWWSTAIAPGWWSEVVTARLSGRASRCDSRATDSQHVV